VGNLELLMILANEYEELKKEGSVLPKEQVHQYEFSIFGTGHKTHQPTTSGSRRTLVNRGSRPASYRDHRIKCSVHNGRYLARGCRNQRTLFYSMCGKVGVRCMERCQRAENGQRSQPQKR